MKYEGKALTTSANSGAELVRTYDTVITETVNNQVVALKLFQQVQGRGQVRIKVRTGRNPAVGSYAESDPIVTGQATRVEIGIYWKLYKAPVEVTGLMIEEAKASGGQLADILNEELRVAVEDMTYTMNSDLFSTATEASAGGAVAGLKRLVDDGDNYSTLYGVTRTGTDWSSATTDETAEALSLARMRTMIYTVQQAGAKKENLVFLTSFKQETAFRNLCQELQMATPTTSAFGFTGVMSLDGVPIIPDQNCDAGYMYLIDVTTFRVYVLLPPTMKPLPSQKDAEAAFVRTYLEVVCLHPYKNYKKIGLT